MIAILASIAALTGQACPGRAHSSRDEATPSLPPLPQHVPMLTKTLYKDAYEQKLKETDRDNAAELLRRIEREVQAELRELKGGTR